MLGASTPASSLEISNSALNSSFIAATAASICAISRDPFDLIRFTAPLVEEQIQSMQWLAQIMARRSKKP